MDLTGQHLGKYELLERVGKGGMAYVYKAYQPTIDRYVAVKALHSHLAEDAEFLERFKREAKGLGSLRHPHIVNVIDFDVADGWYYMVMDFIEGETLEVMLDRRGKLPVDEALALTAQLAGALDYAHQHGRIHRDIKPGNIMFAQAVEQPEAQQHAVITDFGLTRLLDNATITLSGTIAGTPAYMSPEAAQGQKTDARSDIYSLGVMLYEMVTGQRPYLGETPLSVIMKLVMEPLPPALSIDPELPPVLDDILSKAMAKLPEDRYQTAAEMEKEIREWRGIPEPLTIEGPDGRHQAVEAQVDADRTQLLPAEPATPSQLQPVSVTTAQKRGKRKPLPILMGIGLLLVLLVVGLVLFEGFGDRLGEETAVSTPVGSLRFTDPDSNSLRQYTLSLDDVPVPPTGFHYELWFDFADRPAPENVAEVTVQNGRVTYADVLVENLAVNVTSVRLSLEPNVGDDPAISNDVLFTGKVEAESGLAEIEIFSVGK